MATLRYKVFGVIPAFLIAGTLVRAAEAPLANLQPYQQMALQAAIGQKEKGVANSLQLTPYPMASILAAGRQELIAKGPSLAADTTAVCVNPLNQFRPEPTHDKKIGHQADAEAAGKTKVFRLLPVCRSF